MVDEYIPVLYTLLNTCEYGNLQKQMFREHLVGIQDRTHLQWMQLHKDVMLD